MPDVFRALGADHADFRQMLLALENSPGKAAGAGRTVLMARYEVVQRLVMDSSRHEVAEGQLFWPAVRARMDNGDSLADEATIQEQEARAVLSRLAGLDPADDEFDELIAIFTPVVRLHIEFEERRVWPGLRAVLSPAEAQELGSQI
jgi:hypothetical protein